LPTFIFPGFKTDALVSSVPSIIKVWVEGLSATEKLTQLIISTGVGVQVAVFNLDVFRFIIG
jgi:hypothetical protein